MKDQSTISIKDPQVFFLSFCGLGFSPIAPGTVASFFTLPILFLFTQIQISIVLLSLVIVALVLISSKITDQIQKHHNIHDPSWIVIDEVIGMLVSYVIFPTTSLMLVCLIFLFFRFFDIVKIWPASYFDKKVQSGYGTILDDVISGIYTGILLHLLNLFLRDAALAPNFNILEFSLLS